MLVVTIARTKAILAAATRTASGPPAVDELVGDGLYVRSEGTDNGVLVPVSELEVKELDISDLVFRSPLTYVVDASNVALAPSLQVHDISFTSPKITVTVDGTAVPADKSVLVLIDRGPNQQPLTLTSKTTLNAQDTQISVSGVSGGNHVVLATVEGYGTLVKKILFS
jgi:hypothetical protein